MKTKTELLREWLLKNSGADGFFDDDTDLFMERKIDSIKFLDFIEEIRKISGRNLGLEDIHIEKMRTLKLLAEHYL